MPLLLLAGCEREAPGPADVVLILIDTLRADRMSLHGHWRETTPRIDAMAERGVAFERAYAASSWTVPSTAMLHAGKYTSKSLRLGPDNPSLAADLSDAGYATKAVVDNPILVPKRGFDFGFDDFEIRPLHTQREQQADWTGEVLVDKGLEWWDATGGPRFLYLHLFEPHAPYRPQIPDPFDPTPAERIDELHQDLERATPAERRARATYEAALAVADAQRRYDVEIRQADAAVGRLLDELESRGELANTIVVVTSDHGEGLWQRPPIPGANTTNSAPPYPFLYSGHGSQLYSEQVHVPLVLLGPGVPRGERVSTPASLVDVKGTLLRLVGLTEPEIDLLTGLARDPIYGTCAPRTSITVDGRWRLIRPSNRDAKRFGATSELYDLEADPLERTPLDDPERSEALEARLVAWIEAHSDNSGKPRSDAEREELNAQLRALGYADQVVPADEPDDRR
ncbi:MAG: sulfatase [Planctomycetota bacterium]